MAAAKAVDGVIINTDSMQVYPVLSVLTARPSAADETRAPHRLYGTAALSQPYSVARWLADAKDAAEAVWAEGKVPIFVGGTGLYFRALEEGLANTPAIDPVLRADIREALFAEGSAALHGKLVAHDPEGATRLRPSDGQRIARALEVVLQTGKT
ncbi:MAG: tRNA (adenosine(37)-N6)-dimethylallyltransferase MiaA, partial [Pseudomonadota bacterium]